MKRKYEIKIEHLSVIRKNDIFDVSLCIYFIDENLIFNDKGIIKTEVEDFIKSIHPKKMFNDKEFTDKIIEIFGPIYDNNYCVIYEMWQLCGHVKE